jgi:hypothetical protein
MPIYITYYILKKVCDDIGTLARKLEIVLCHALIQIPVRILGVGVGALIPEKIHTLHVPLCRRLSFQKTHHNNNNVRNWNLTDKRSKISFAALLAQDPAF